MRKCEKFENIFAQGQRKQNVWCRCEWLLNDAMHSQKSPRNPCTACGNWILAGWKHGCLERQHEGQKRDLGGGTGCQEDSLNVACERLLFQLTCTNQSFPIMHIMQEKPAFTCFRHLHIPGSCIELLCCTELGTRAGRAKMPQKMFNLLYLYLLHKTTG